MARDEAKSHYEAGYTEAVVLGQSAKQFACKTGGVHIRKKRSVFQDSIRTWLTIAVVVLRVEQFSQFA
jgi:hypothetical protein